MPSGGSAMVGNVRYTYEHENPKHFDVAESKCKENGGHLAYLKNQTVIDEVAENAKGLGGTTYWWIGLKYDDQLKTYAWLDGEKYKHYSQGNPGIKPNYCGVIETGFKKIYTYNCSALRSFYYICENKIEASAAPPLTSSIKTRPTTQPTNATVKPQGRNSSPTTPNATSAMSALIPVVVVLSIALISLVLYLIYRRRKRQKQGGVSSTAPRGRVGPMSNNDHLRPGGKQMERMAYSNVDTETRQGNYFEIQNDAEGGYSQINTPRTHLQEDQGTYSTLEENLPADGGGVRSMTREIPSAHEYDQVPPEAGNSSTAVYTAVNKNAKSSSSRNREEAEPSDQAMPLYSAVNKTKAADGNEDQNVVATKDEYAVVRK